MLPLVLMILLFSPTQVVFADVLVLPEKVEATQHNSAVSPLKDGDLQPYVVKKGDTLWDIADYFFQDPWQWLKIWEKNLYITNPDLIYPGNRIVFDGRWLQQQGGLRVEKLHPQIVKKRVERLPEDNMDRKRLMAALQRQDFISMDHLQGIGYVLDSRDERMNYGNHDAIYVKLSQDLPKGTLLDLFRRGEPVRDPKSGKNLGALVQHLGQLRLLSQEHGIYRAVIIKSFEEISRGDRLKVSITPSQRLLPHRPVHMKQGQVIYIRHAAREAGQYQMVAIDLGRSAGVEAGMLLPVYRQGRVTQDQVSGKSVQLPRELLGQLMVVAVQQHASMAMLTRSVRTVHIGDGVGSF